MADRKEKLTFVISALDKASAPFKRMAASANRMAAPFRRMGIQFKAMGKSLGFDRMGKAVGRIRGAFSDMGGAITRLLAPLGALGFALVKVSTDMQRIEAQAASVGMSTDALLGYVGAVKALGFDADKVVDLVEEMNNKIGESKGLGATTPVKEAMHMLKLDFQEIAKLKPEEQFERIMNAAAGMKDQQMASSAVDILMGGDANKIMGSLRAQADEQNTTVKELLAKYRKMNLTTDEGRAGLKQFSESWKNFSTIISSAFTELMGVVGNQLAPMFKNMSTWIMENFDEIKTAFKDKLPGAIKAVGAAFRGLYNAVSPIVEFFSWLSETIGTENAAMVGFAGVLTLTVLPAIASLTTAFIALGSAIGFTPLGWIVGAFAAVVAIGVTLYKNWERVTEAWNKYSDALYFTPLAPLKIMVDLVGLLIDNFDTLWSVIKEGMGYLKENLWDPFLKGLKMLMGNLGELFEGIRSKVEAMSNIGKNLKSGFKQFFGLGGDQDVDRARGMAEKSRQFTNNKFSEHTNNANVNVVVAAPEGSTMSTSGDADISASLNTGAIMVGS